jgi:hypothetical protein
LEREGEGEGEGKGKGKGKEKERQGNVPLDKIAGRRAKHKK